MQDTKDGGSPGGAGQPRFTFQLSARNDQPVPRFHAMMMDPGQYLISLVKEPGYTAWEYTTLPGRWTTEFYLYRPHHLRPECGVSEFLSNTSRSDDADAAFAKFEDKVITIPGDWPLPVMFCINDPQHKDNRGGLSVLVKKL